MTPHYWNGQWIDEAGLDRRLGTLARDLPEELGHELPMDALFQACRRTALRLAPGEALHRGILAACADERHPAADVVEALEEVRAFLRPEDLERKLRRELGQGPPGGFEPVDPEVSILEAWAPLGFLVHVAPANALSVGPLTVVEGLLAGNLNFLKTPGGDPPFASLVLEALVEESGGALAPFVKVARIGSDQAARLRKALDQADGVAVWGGEEAVAALRDKAPRGVRVIEWGHRISFAYVASDRLEADEVLEPLAVDCCRSEQQACSSPQVLYLETNRFEDLQRFADRFVPVLDRVSGGMPRRCPGAAEWAEITSVREIHRREGLLEGLRAEVREAPDRSWRLLLDERPALVPSPLFRTVWLKPLPREEVVATLRPMRGYLQTVGLAAGRESAFPLARRLVQAGAARVTEPGRMQESYPGEAHDGVYALQRYSRRVGLRGDGFRSLG